VTGVPVRAKYVSPVATIKDAASESRLFRARTLVAAIGIAALSLALLLRLAHLQVAEFEHFATLSEDNRVKIVPVPPTRGLIFDRNGVVLAENVAAFSLELVPEAVKDLDGTLDALSQILEITDADRQRFERLLRSSGRFERVPIRLRLSEDEVARFSVNRHRFPGVDVEARLGRHYPLGALTAHVVGYVARINEQELERLNAAEYRGTSHIGKTGIEQAYEDTLHGRVGYQHVEINAQGRVLRVLERRDPIPGDNLMLNLDIGLQQQAVTALAGEQGSVVAIDPLTGGVLAMVSLPDFDPNLFVDGIDAKTYTQLLRSQGRPLFNRALNGQYPPGSTIKPFFALAGLELGLDKARQKVWCPGWFRLPGKAHRYRDWKRGGHGHVTLDEAIVQSCDVYFYELALDMGIDRMHQFMRRFGFGERTGIDLTGESKGLNPSRSWKRASKQQPWYPGETLITGIGQGFSLATPLQLAHGTATLAMRGLKLSPRIVMHRERRAPVTGQGDGIEAPAVQVAAQNPANWQKVVDSMEAVVHGARGTARRIAVGADYRMAGKTGTAQVFSIGQQEKYDGESIAKALRDHALFVAFAPVERPRIAVSVLIENGGSGSRTAAPVARAVMDHYMQSPAQPAPANPMIMTAVPRPQVAH
jgi:penicillin-binding protein 2